MPGYRHIVKNNYTLNAQKISKNENRLTDDFFYTEATSRQSNNFRSKMANFKPHMPLTNGRVKSTLNGQI